MKYKVGDKVRCMSDDFTYLTKGKIYTVTDIDNSNNNIDIFDDEGDIDTYSFRYFEPVTKTLDNLEVGDILVDKYNNETEVLAVYGKVYCLSNWDNFGGDVLWYTLESIKKYGWKLKEELEPKVKKAIKLLEEKGYKVEK